MVGIFMDMTPAVLIFTPIFLPIVTSQLGIDPIHFGIIMIIVLMVVTYFPQLSMWLPRFFGY